MTATGVLRQASWICTDNADKFMQRVNRASFSSCYSRSQELSCWNQYKFLYCSGNWWKVASLECCQLQDAWEEQEEQDALMDCLVKRCLLLYWSRGEVLQMLHFCNGVPIAWHFWIIRLCVCLCVVILQKGSRPTRLFCAILRKSTLDGWVYGSFQSF